MANIAQQRELKRAARHQRIRRKVHGRTERPRLCVHRSLKGFYAQVVDDQTGKVLFGMSTRNKTVRDKVKNGGNIEGAAALGAALGVLAKAKGVTLVSFDRGGYLYHGRVKAFAEAVRKSGLEF